MQSEGSLDGGLRVEFRGKGNLEQDIFHDIRAEGLGQLNGLAAKERIAKSPGFGRKRRGITYFSLDRQKGMLDAAAGSVAGRSGFGRTCAGSVAVGRECASTQPGLRTV